MKYIRFSITLFQRYTSCNMCISRNLLATTKTNFNSSPKYKLYILPVWLHTSSSLPAKMFQDKENEIAHSVMTSNISYAETTAKLLGTDRSPFGDSSTPKTSKEVEEFAEVTNHACLHDLHLENEKFKKIVSDIVVKLPVLTDHDVLQVLHLLSLWPPSPKSYSPNFKLIWNDLDFECAKRMKGWDVNRKLLVADYWFCLRLSRITHYNKTLITNLLENLSLLTDTQVVQLMFLINLQRKVPPAYMKSLENRLGTIIDSVSLEEVGIICLGFFKTENKITNFNTIQLIINRLHKEVKTISRTAAVSILKFLKKSVHPLKTENYIPLLHACIPCIQKWDVKAAIHLALLSAELHVYHPLLLNTVTEKVADNIDSALIKDCTKLLQCHAHFNHSPGFNFKSLLLQEFEKESRDQELMSHPRDLIYSALYFAYLGEFSDTISRQVLDGDFIEYCELRCPETRNAFAEFDYCIEIECKDYAGLRFPKAELGRLENRRGNMPDNPKYKNIVTNSMNEILEALSALEESENIFVRHILPHLFSPDIIVRLSKGSLPLSSYANVPSDVILVPPRNEVWASLVVSAPFSFAYRSHHLSGVTAMKLRQLKKLGYTVVFIPYYEVSKNATLRKEYLKEKLDAVRKCDDRLSIKF